MSGQKEIVKLNLEQEICPYTLIGALKKAKELEKEIRAGLIVLEISIDHPPATDNFPAEFSKRGYKLSIKKIGSAKWLVSVSI